jgi:predicted nucleic acid-binding protein
MTRHCYDTSILVGILRDDPRALKLICEHEDAGENGAATAITAYELALRAPGTKEKNDAAQLLESMEGLGLDMTTAFIAGQIQNELYKNGKPAGLRDLLIATIAKEAGWRLHTFDQNFPNIDGLDFVIHE